MYMKNNQHMTNWEKYLNDSYDEGPIPKEIGDQLIEDAYSGNPKACFIIGLLLFQKEIYDKAEYYLSKAAKQEYYYYTGELDRLRRYSDVRNKRITRYMYSTLESIATDEDYCDSIEQDNCLLNKDKTKLLKVLNHSQKSQIIPDNVICLCDSSINDLNYQASFCIEKLILPRSLKTVGSNVLNTDIKNIVSYSRSVFVEDNALFSYHKRALIKYFGNSNEYEIPGCVEFVHGGAFRSSNPPKVVVIPESVVEMDGNPFPIIKGHHIIVDSWSPFFATNDGFVIDLIDRKIVSFLGNSLDVTIPIGIESLGKDSFFSSEIESLFLPNTIKIIEESALHDCDKLRFIHVMPGFKDSLLQLLPNYLLERVTVIEDYCSPDYLSYKDTLKPDSKQIAEYLSRHEINCFYHFTDKSNLPLIKMSGGLYSWRSTINRKIKVPHPGGSDLSHSLDLQYLIDDYVHLSFCSNHPMAFRLIEENAELVVFKIKVDVAYQLETLFTDINATDKYHHVGGGFKDLLNVDINAVKQTTVRKDSDIFKKNQAEVLVKSFIPKEFILNFDNPFPINTKSGATIMVDS